MKKDEKGFTLVELLTIIAIIAIIALITIPIFGTMIDNSKKSAFKTSVKNITETIDIYLLDKYDGRFKTEKTFNISTGGITEVKDGVTGDFLKFDGTIKGNGEIKVNSDGEYYIRYSDGEYCAKKQYTDEDIIFTNGECN